MALWSRKRDKAERPAHEPAGEPAESVHLDDDEAHAWWARAEVGTAWKPRERSGDSKGGGMMRALAVRIAVSVLVFACIVAAWALGWIQPTGVPLSR